MTTNRPSCYHCHSEESERYAEENGFWLLRCAGCGLLYLESPPALETITEAHRQGVHSGDDETDATGEFRETKIAVYRKVLSDLFGPHLPSIEDWLDVGCGHGEFMLAVQGQGGSTLRVRGTEPNIHKQASARAHGLNDVGYFDLETHQEKYDVISLLNVYSHLPDPPAFLATLAGLLKPGGELVLQTGDTAGLAAEDHYRPFFLPNHMSFGSEKIVRELLEHAGFEVLRVQKYPYPGLYRPPMSPWIVCKECIKALIPGRPSMLPRYREHFRKRRIYARTDMYLRARLNGA